jgi:ribose-phosphate pyrophosphokinase
MTATLHAFAEDAAPAGRLAAALGIGCCTIASRRFPEGERQVQVDESEPLALVYRTLADPDVRLVELLLAADALRDRGVRRLTLVAPYLPYMRQDIAFAPGQAVSQRVIGRLLARSFDAVVTVDPHLHRTPHLADVLPDCLAVNVSAAGSIAAAVQGRLPADAVIVGPDSESQPWVAALAAALGCDWLVAEKQRHGLREVTITLPGSARVAGRAAFLVDDILSSGGTLLACAAVLRAAGARIVGAGITHCFASPDDLARLAAAGITPILVTDSIPGPNAAIALAPALADAIRRHALA